MTNVKNENIFIHVVNYSGLKIELHSDNIELLKLDFIKGQKKSETKVKDVIPEPIKTAILFLDDYFHGRKNKMKIILNTNYKENDFKKNTDSLIINMTGYTEKEIRIYRELLNVEPGETVSYSELASRAGISRGARFAGNCMAGNRFPIIIPCHRVIKKDGSTGFYTGGEGIKELLLKHEASVRHSQD